MGLSFELSSGGVRDGLTSFTSGTSEISGGRGAGDSASDGGSEVLGVGVHSSSSGRARGSQVVGSTKSLNHFGKK